MTHHSPAGSVTPEMIAAGRRVIPGYPGYVVAEAYRAMRLARPLSEGPGITDTETKRSAAATILLRILILAVFVAIWHARG